MCSNIVFPNITMEKIDTTYTNSFNIDDISLNNFIGETGLKNIVNERKINKQIKYIFKDEKYNDFFKLENLKNYSSKIHNFIENVNSSEGIIFVYSQYIYSGVIPLALALEYNGYSRLNNSLINDTSIPNKGNYIIISGNNDLSKNAYSNYIKLENDNKNGEKVKIIIGSETAAEGLDFKYIRQVHILDPWFHLNKIEQIIGRGIRNCSHIELPPKDRNVTIFLYALINNNRHSNNNRTNNETLDLEIYRKAELKSKQMSKIEYIIKKNSVDCNLNKESNIFDNDIDYSKKCNYEKCNYSCSPDINSIIVIN